MRCSHQHADDKGNARGREDKRHDEGADTLRYHWRAGACGEVRGVPGERGCSLDYGGAITC